MSTVSPRIAQNIFGTLKKIRVNARARPSCPGIRFQISSPIRMNITGTISIRHNNTRNNQITTPGSQNLKGLPSWFEMILILMSYSSPFNAFSSEISPFSSFSSIFKLSSFLISGSSISTSTCTMSSFPAMRFSLFFTVG